MNSTLLWKIPACILISYLLWLWYAYDTARHNVKELRRPNYVAGNIFAIQYPNWQRIQRTYRSGIIVFDVDLTLCDMHADHLRKSVCDYLHARRDQGFMIILASKSNPHLDAIYRQLDGDQSWLLIWPKASKSSANFYDEIVGMSDRAGWRPLVKGQIVLVGDKLTDMGHSNARHDAKVVTILTNPAFGKDLRLETFPALRRWRENIMLRKFFGVVRAKHHLEFREV